MRVLDDHLRHRIVRRSLAPNPLPLPLRHIPGHWALGYLRAVTAEGSGNGEVVGMYGIDAEVDDQTRAVRARVELLFAGWAGEGGSRNGHHQCAVGMAAVATVAAVALQEVEAEAGQVANSDTQ